MQAKDTAPVEHAAYKAMIQQSWGRISKPWRMYEQVHPEWLESFDNFYRDMGECPPGCELVRPDQNKRWQKGNAVWA